MFGEIVNRPSRWRTFWPDVSDVAGARDAIQLAVWFAYLEVVLGGIGMLVALISGGAVVAQFMTMVVFGLVGLGIKHGWRTVAVFAAVLVGLSVVHALAQLQLPGVLTPFVLVGFINGVRGTFALKRHERQAPKDTLAL